MYNHDAPYKHDAPSLEPKASYLLLARSNYTNDEITLIPSKRQVFQGLQYLHDELKIAHCGTYTTLTMHTLMHTHNTPFTQHSTYTIQHTNTHTTHTHTHNHMVDLKPDNFLFLDKSKDSDLKIIGIRHILTPPSLTP